MRVSKELLIQNAEQAAEDSARLEKDLLAVLLTGALVRDEELLSDSNDIDLIYIHKEYPEDREFVRLTENIHLDIHRLPREAFEPARDLRTNAWLGTALFNGRPLYDPEHFLDFIQASVRGMFFQPENRLQRAAPFLKQARQIWMDFHNNGMLTSPAASLLLLEAMEGIGNAMATLNEGPLPTRRFLGKLKPATEALGHPGLYMGFLGLLGLTDTAPERLKNWLPDWEKLYDQVSSQAKNQAVGHPHRKNYYLNAIEALLHSSEPLEAAWPMLFTWAKMAESLHPGAAAFQEWERAFSQLGLYGEQFEAKLDGLDAYLDTVEEVFENWQNQRGLSQ